MLGTVAAIALLVALMTAQPILAKKPADSTPTPQIPLPPASTLDSVLGREMLLTYYNAINVRNYQAAFSMWLTPQQTYDQFASGYADTLRVEPYFGELQPTNIGANSNMVLDGNVPAVLLGYHIDGSVATYTGCFSLSLTAVKGWRIGNASFQLLSNTAVPDRVTRAAFLNMQCGVPPAIQVQFVPPETNQLSVSSYAALTNYYTLINARNFAGAYAMWLQPIPGPKPNGAPPADYRLPYDQFVAGYANTTAVSLYMGDCDCGGGFAGHGYIAGVVPAVLIGEHVDGTFVTYYGCYVMGGFISGGMGIVSGNFQQISQDVPNGSVILSLLSTPCQPSIQQGLQY
jgi:hypothetical protein